jgi:hypothetical protein
MNKVVKVCGPNVNLAGVSGRVGYKLNDEDLNELFPYNKKALNSHATIDCYVTLEVAGNQNCVLDYLKIYITTLLCAVITYTLNKK